MDRIPNGSGAGQDEVPPVGDLADHGHVDYRPLRGRANLARGSLALITLASVIWTVFQVDALLLLGRIGTGEPVGWGELTASDDRFLVLAAVWWGLWLACAITFIAWLHRAYTNLRLFRAEPRFGSGWVIGGWFVPIMSLYRPKQVVNDVWRASDPGLEEPAVWRGRPVPRLFALWWAAYLAIGVAEIVAAGFGAGAETADEKGLAGTVGLVASVIPILAGILALVVVDRTTERQANRIAVLGGSELAAARAPRWLRGGRRIGAAVALCGAAVAGGVLVLEDSVPRVKGEAQGEWPEAASAAPAGFSHLDNFSDPASGWLEDDDAGSSFSYHAGQYRMTAKRPGESWLSYADLGVALEHVEVEADATLRPPASDDDGVGMGCFASSGAGYLLSVWPDGYYAIEVASSGAAEWALLADGRLPPPHIEAGELNRMAIECAAGSPSTLTLSVDGRELARAQHTDGLGPFQVIAPSVVSGPGTAVVDFDDLAVRAVGR